MTENKYENWMLQEGYSGAFFIGLAIKKFVDTVGQITFSGQYAPDDQEVLYVTERAVFKLIDHKMTLIEIAPGIDLEKDVLAAMDFRPEISPDLKVMDPAIFQEHWGGLGEYMK